MNVLEACYYRIQVRRKKKRGHFQHSGQQNKVGSKPVQFATARRGMKNEVAQTKVATWQGQ